ncbi:MAG: hypothetical protein ACOX3D_00930 [Syntrophomonadales bacterium]
MKGEYSSSLFLFYPPNATREAPNPALLSRLILCSHQPAKYRVEPAQPVDGTNITKEEIITYCREKLAAYKVPRSVESGRNCPAPWSPSLQ